MLQERDQNSPGPCIDSLMVLRAFSALVSCYALNCCGSIFFGVLPMFSLAKVSSLSFFSFFFIAFFSFLKNPDAFLARYVVESVRRLQCESSSKPMASASFCQSSSSSALSADCFLNASRSSENFLSSHLYQRWKGIFCDLTCLKSLAALTS